MTTTIISTNPQYAFGNMTNRMVSSLINGNALIERLNDAVKTASAGYTGTPGTEFEVPANAMAVGSNLFGVLESATPGEQGAAYAYAVGRLQELWAAFWTDAQTYVEQLDNGTTNQF